MALVVRNGRSSLPPLLAVLVLLAIVMSLAGLAPAVAGEPAPRIDWTRHLDRLGIEFPASVAVNGDGGIFVTGAAPVDRNGAQAIRVLRFDSRRHLLWRRTIPGLWGYRSAAATTPDNALVLAAGTVVGESRNASYQALVLRLAPSGGVAWGRPIRGQGARWPAAVAVRPDGTIFVAGTFASPAAPDDPGVRTPWFLSELEPDGSSMHTTIYRSKDWDDRPTSLAITDSGEVYVGLRSLPADRPAFSFTGPPSSFGVAKIAADGTREWVRRIDGDRWGQDRWQAAANDIALTPDGGVVAAGEAGYGTDANPVTSEIQLVLASFGADGRVGWFRRQGGRYYDSASSLVRLADGRLIVAGGTYHGRWQVNAANVLLATFTPDGRRETWRSLGAAGFVPSALALGADYDVYLTTRFSAGNPRRVPVRPVLVRLDVPRPTVTP